MVVTAFAVGWLCAIGIACASLNSFLALKDFLQDLGWGNRLGYVDVPLWRASVDLRPASHQSPAPTW